MNKLEKMKEQYDKIFIPEELDVRVRQEIMKSRKRQAEENSIGQRHRAQDRKKHTSELQSPS